MGYNDCRHGAEMCDECLDIMSDGIKQGAEGERKKILEILKNFYRHEVRYSTIDGDLWKEDECTSTCRVCELINIVEKDV